MSLVNAYELIDRCVAPRPAELVPIEAASGRVLAEDVLVDADIPPAARAAVDGVALASRETVGASAYNPLVFHIAAAGFEPRRATGVIVAAGDAMPAGTDAVLRLDQMHDLAGILDVIEPVASGENVEAAGSQAAGATILLRQRCRLRAHDTGLLASAGRTQVAVVCRPRVRILIVTRGMLRDANGPILRASVERDGGVAEGPISGLDGCAGIAAAVAAPGADLVLVAGGSGNGPGDETASALRSAGEIVFHGITLTPSGTAGLARTSLGIPAILLPGTPAACLCAYEMLAGRAVRRQAGRNPEPPFQKRAMKTARKIVSAIGRTEIVPVRCRNADSVEPTASFAGAGLFALADADGFVIVPESSEGHPPGATVTVHFYGDMPRATTP